MQNLCVCVCVCGGGGDRIVQVIRSILSTTFHFKTAFGQAVIKTHNLYVCILHHLSQEWTKLEMTDGAPWPQQRSSHAACCLNYGQDHPQLLVTGGKDNNDNTLNDMWILDVKSGRWREVRDDIHMTNMVNSISTLFESAVLQYQVKVEH